MTIDDGFRKMLDGVKQADEGRDEIMRGLEAAWAARRDLDSQMHDLRETIDELKRMITQQGDQIVEQGRLITALRTSLDNNGGAR